MEETAMNTQEVLHLESLSAAQPVLKALAAPMRLRMMELLWEEGDRNLNDLAQLLGLTNSAISLHTKVLEEAGLVSIHTMAGKRGSMKICRPLYQTLIIDLDHSQPEKQTFYEDIISVGCYNSCDIRPTCGIATPGGVIGEFDNPRYFQFPEHYQAKILWLGSGYVEYTLPNHLSPGQTATSISLSFELSSECPGYNEDFPSDISFYFNGICLGCWVSPGDFGARTGRFTPDWWPRHCNQYGLLKTLTVTDKGTFIDGGNQISDVKISDLHINYNSTFTFRLGVSPDSRNCGGMTLFGQHFGDYDQDIIFRTSYKMENREQILHERNPQRKK